MFKFLIKILLLILSTYNLVKFFLSNLAEKKTVIFYYFPVNAYSKNIIEINQKIRPNKNFKSYFVYNNKSAKQIKHIKNSFFLDFELLRFIPLKKIFLKKVDIFISSYVNYIFPPNSINIYICHDIADAPMVNKNLEKKIFISLNKYNYIFLSSDLVVKYYKKKFSEYIGKKINPTFVNTGYLKLDNVIRELKKEKSSKKKILIAPTSSFMMREFNLSNNLVEIINNLLKLKHPIIYRPHPIDLTNRGNKRLVRLIKDKFSKNNNFEIDLSTSYLNSYANAKLLLTDFSGTAYTFAYSTLKPVIFFSHNEKKLQNSKNSNLYYFKDRKHIGEICDDKSKLKLIINKMEQTKTFYSKKIYSIRKKRIKYLNKSLDSTSNEIIGLRKKYFSLQI